MKRMMARLLPSVAVVGALTLVPMTSATVAAQDVDTYRELENFLSVFEQVRANYVDEVDDHTLIKGAIDGMLAALDPHSSYVEATEFQSMRHTTDGEYGGLGLTVSMRDGAVIVVAPTEDTPADKAGVKAGDYITHVDGKLLYGFTLDESVDLMRGKPGTKVSITVVRPGRNEPIEFDLTRAIIDLKPVKWEVKDGVGIININSFSAQVGADVADAIRSIDCSLGSAKPLGYVVDLRSNPGGLLDQAIEVSDIFLERGEVVSQRGRAKGDIERYYATPGDLANGRPVIVLIDSGSASASEIVAGALQDHRRAVVMGERSFGKGSVQTVVQTGPASALRLTTARYYTPSGHSVQAGGIEPDIEVPQLSDPDFFNRPRLREADLRRHLVAQDHVDDAVLESDDTVDPRFAETAEQVKAKGIEDYQLYYAISSLKRVAAARTGVQTAGGQH